MPLHWIVVGALLVLVGIVWIGVLLSDHRDRFDD